MLSHHLYKSSALRHSTFELEILRGKIGDKTTNIRGIPPAQIRG